MSFFLNRGGAGKSLTRAETVTEISSLVERHVTLLGSYDKLETALGSDSVSAHSIRELARSHRLEIARLSEIVLSNSGAPPREADPFDVDEVESLLRQLTAGERELREAIEHQLSVRHHKRTAAVLENQLAATEDRIGTLQELARQYSVPVG